MPRKKHSELAAGLFVILGLVAAVGVVLWLGAVDMFKPTAQEVFFSSDYLAGSYSIDIGKAIKLNDMPIGKIIDIRLDAENHRTLYVARIEHEDVKIYSNGKAQAAAGLVGSADLVITSVGDPNAPQADAENPIKIDPGMNQAMGDLAKMASQLSDEELIAKIRNIVDNIDIAASGIRMQLDPDAEAALMNKIHRSMDDVNAISSDAKPKISQTLTAAASAAEKIDAYVTKDVGYLLAEFRKITTRVLEMSNNFKDVSSQAKDLLMVNRDRIDTIIDDMSLIAANLKAASTEIRRSPWRLLHKPSAQEVQNQNLYDAARAFVLGSQRLDMSLSKLKGLAAARPDGIAANDPELIKIKQQLEETFGQFSKAERALWKELSK